MFLTIEHKNVTEKLTAFLWFEPLTTCVEIKRGNEPNSNKKASQTNKHQVLYISENREISHNNVLANLAGEKTMANQEHASLQKMRLTKQNATSLE